MRIEDSKIPRAMYPCAMECGTYFYEARDLAWYPGCDKYEPGYYCDECLDANDMHMVRTMRRRRILYLVA